MLLSMMLFITAVLISELKSFIIVKLYFPPFLLQIEGTQEDEIVASSLNFDY